MNTRNTLRTMLCTLTALTAVIGGALAQGPALPSTRGIIPIRTIGPVLKSPLPLALPDLAFEGVNPCYEEGYNYRVVVVINKGNAYAPPTTMYMTWLGYDAGVFCIKFYAYAVKGLAPGEDVAIWVEPGAECYQYSKGSTVHFFLDYYNAIWESNKQNNSVEIDN
ncbi:MAG: hypothetical protein JWN14_5030 [Chthonomonadales bacterium]|nr:hypothetical protein [Chthonomonadales bacterium]